MKQKVFDSHVHFWDMDLGEQEWLQKSEQDIFLKTLLGDYSSICENQLPQNLKEGLADIELIGVAHIQAGWKRSRSLAEAKWLANLNSDCRLPNSVINYVDLIQSTSSVQKDLELFSQFELTRGIRQTLSWHPQSEFSGCSKNLLSHPSIKKGICLLDKSNSIFELQAYPLQGDEVIEILSLDTGITFLVEHCGMPLFLEQADELIWFNYLKKVSKYPNVYLKLSGLEMFENYLRFRYSKKDIYEICIDIFGVERCVFGSNFPIFTVKKNRTYSSAIEEIKSLNPTATEADMIFYQNSLHVYKPILVKNTES